MAEIPHTEIQTYRPRQALYNSHSHKTPQSVLATHSGDVIQTAERNPIMNPQKTNLERLESQKDCFQDMPFSMLQQSSRCAGQPQMQNPLWQNSGTVSPLLECSETSCRCAKRNAANREGQLLAKRREVDPLTVSPNQKLNVARA